LFCSDTGDEVAGVLVLVLEGGFFDPFAPYFDGTVRGDEPCGCGADGFDGGLAFVDASVVVFDLVT
jgi:hypothetical protein